MKMIRISDEHNEMLRKIAEQNKRSMTKHIEMMIETEYKNINGEMKMLNKITEFKKEYLGKTINLTELPELCGIENLFDDEVFNLPVGLYNKQIEGSHSICIGNDDYANFIYHTVGDWEVMDNSGYSNINLTVIDENSVRIKITKIEKC